MRPMKSLGHFLETNSLIDGAPLVVVLIPDGRSTNTKTGPMAQTYILRADVPPVEAAKTGDDASVCGSCPLRPTLAEPHDPRCYVNKGHGPRAVWDAWKRGRYANAGSIWGLAAATHASDLRLGTYGDPGAVNSTLWWAMAANAKTHTGYTHRWRDTGADLRGLCMASVDSLAEQREAKALGWTTFRIVRLGDPRVKGEAICPASERAGRKVQCITCPIGCNGRGLDVVIDDHGPTRIR